MGRNYIGERTLWDPRQREAEKARRKRAAAKRRAAEQQGMAAYLERARWCHRKGCDQQAESQPGGWWPCCSEACYHAWFDALPEPGARRRR